MSAINALNTVPKPASDAQLYFDSHYITAAQVMQDLQITRTALLYARRTGKLPEPIVVNNGRLYIWLKEEIQPYLDTWKIVLNSRRGV